jgi:hypothetical protein
MKKSNLPIAGLIIVISLLLISTGVAYGLWSKTLDLNGTVNTGSINVHWDGCYCADNGIDPFPNPWPYPYPKPDPKDVGETICEVDSQDPTLMHMTVNNGYPSYFTDCEYHFENLGSLPVKIIGYKTYPNNFTLASANGAEDGELWVKYYDGVGSVMDPCPDDDNCEQSGSVMLHVEQPAQMNSTYTFDVKICLAQWNEPATFNQCLAAAQP